MSAMGEYVVKNYNWDISFLDIQELNEELNEVIVGLLKSNNNN